MTHACPWGRLWGVSSHHLPGKLAAASMVPAAPELPGKNYLASRQVVRWSQNGNLVSLPRGFHFPEGFTHVGFCRLLQQGVGDPPRGAWPSTSTASTDPGIKFPGQEAALVSKTGGKRKNVGICPDTGFLLACLRMALTLWVLQWKVMSGWAAARHHHPSLWISHFQASLVWWPPNLSVESETLG